MMRKRQDVAEKSLFLQCDLLINGYRLKTRKYFCLGDIIYCLFVEMELSHERPEA